MSSPVKPVLLACAAGGAAYILYLQRRKQRRRKVKRAPSISSVAWPIQTFVTHQKKPVPMILISDPGQDLDDEMSYIMLRHLVEENLVDLKGIIATLAPSFDRARLCRGTLDLLGLHQCPVGIGSDGGDLEGNHTAKSFEESAASYMPATASESCATLTPGRGLMYRLYHEAAPRSLTLCIIASLKDAALFLRDHESLFAAKTLKVVIMGGVEPVEAGAAEEGEVLLKPDTANNNTFDAVASEYFYRRVQEIGVPLVVVSRWAAYAAKMPRDVYDDLALSGSSIGWRLRNAQRDSIETLWRRACGTTDEVRKKLPARCDRKWFISTFCAGKDDPARTGDDAVWDLVDGFMQYDTVAVLAAIPSIRDKYFAPTPYKGPGGTTHWVVGPTQQQAGVAEPAALIKLLQVGFTTGLSLNHAPKAHVILMIQLRWDNMPDVRQTCVMLRALWGLGIMDCVGLIVSLDRLAQPDASEPSIGGASGAAPAAAEAIGQGPHPPFKRKLTDNKTSTKNLVTDVPVAAEASGKEPHPHLSRQGSSMGSAADAAAEEALLEQASEISATLHALGLAHVKVHVVSNHRASTSAVEHLRHLYASAPPVGVTLVVTSTFTEVAAFATEDPQLFRQKTVRVIHMGAAQLVSQVSAAGEYTGASELAPEPTAQNNRLDLDAAQLFYRRAQELSVPLVIISRHLAHACRVPAELFDILAAHGGHLGNTVRDEQRESFNELWARANAPAGDPTRRALPARCDREWFVRSFCNKEHPPGVGDEDVWHTVESVRLYNPMALLVSLPPFVDQFLESTPLTVRSAKHRVIGLSDDSGCVHRWNLGRLRSLIYQCLYNGTTANASEYALGSPPPLPVFFKGENIEPRGAQGAYGPPHGLNKEPSTTLLQESSLAPLEPMRLESAPPSLGSPREAAAAARDAEQPAAAAKPKKVSKWTKVRSVQTSVGALRPPTLDRDGLAWHSDPSESALMQLLLGSRSLQAWHRAEHVLL